MKEKHVKRGSRGEEGWGPQREIEQNNLNTVSVF